MNTTNNLVAQDLAVKIDMERANYLLVRNINTWDEYMVNRPMFNHFKTSAPIKSGNLYVVRKGGYQHKGIRHTKYIKPVVNYGRVLPFETCHEITYDDDPYVYYRTFDKKQSSKRSVSERVLLAKGYKYIVKTPDSSPTCSGEVMETTFVDGIPITSFASQCKSICVEDVKDPIMSQPLIPSVKLEQLLPKPFPRQSYYGRHVQEYCGVKSVAERLEWLTERCNDKLRCEGKRVILTMNLPQEIRSNTHSLEALMLYFPTLAYELHITDKMIKEEFNRSHGIVALVYQQQTATYAISNQCKTWNQCRTGDDMMNWIRVYMSSALQQRVIIDMDFNLPAEIVDTWEWQWEIPFPDIAPKVWAMCFQYRVERHMDTEPKCLMLRVQQQSSSTPVISEFEEYLELLRGVSTTGNGRPQLPKGTRLSRELAAYHFQSVQDWERAKREVHENRWCKAMLEWNSKKLFDDCSRDRKKKKSKSMIKKLKRAFRKYESQGWREVVENIKNGVTRRVTRMAAGIAANICHNKMHQGLDFMIKEFTSNFTRASSVKDYLMKLYCAICLALDVIDRPNATKSLIYIAHLFFDNMCTFGGAAVFAATDVLTFVLDPILAFVRQLSKQMKRKKPETGDPVIDNFQSQSETNVFTSFVTVFNYAFFGKDMPDSKSEKRLKALSTLGHAITGTQTLFKFLYSCFEFVGRKVFKEYLDIDIFPNEASDLRKDIQKAEEMLLEIANHMTLKPNDKESARKYLFIIQKDFAAIETRVNNCVKSNFTSAFISFRRHYMQLYQRLDACIKTKTSRTHPVASLHLGITGSGKTSAGWWLTRLLMDENDPYRVDDNIFYRNRQADFWDGYSQQKVVIFDELFQSKEPARIALESEEIFGMLNNARYNLNMASLEQKANTAFTSRYVFFTSNFADTKIMETKPRPPSTLELPTDVAKQVTSIDALGSRFRDQVYVITRRSGSTSKRMDTFDSNNINHPELREALMDWEFYRYKYEPKLNAGGSTTAGYFSVFKDSKGAPMKYDIFQVAQLLREANEMYEKSDIAELASRVELDKLCPPHCSVVGGVIQVNKETFVSQAGGEEAKEEEDPEEDNIREQVTQEDTDLVHQIIPYTWIHEKEDDTKEEVVETKPMIVAYVTQFNGTEKIEFLTVEEFERFHKSAISKMLYVNVKGKVNSYVFTQTISKQWAELFGLFDVIIGKNDPFAVEYKINEDVATSAYMDAFLRDDTIPIWQKIKTFGERCIEIVGRAAYGATVDTFHIQTLITVRVLSWMFGISYLGYLKRHFVTIMMMIMVRETFGKFEYSLSNAFDSVKTKYRNLNSIQKGVVGLIGVGVVGVGVYSAYKYLTSGKVPVEIFEEQSKQYPDSNQPTKVSASTRRGPLAKDIKVAKFQSQSGYCKQFEDQKPKTNQFIPIGVIMGTECKTVHALNIGDKHLLFQAHVFSQLFSQEEELKNELSKRTRIVLPNEHYTGVVEIPITDFEGKMAVDESRDYCLLDCRHLQNVPLTPKIWHRFMRNDEVKRIRFNSETKLIVPGLRMETQDKRPVIRGDNSLEIRDVHFVKATGYYGNTGPEESKDYCFTEGIVYNGANTSLGDCGSLYMINDKSAPHKYVGMHTGGLEKSALGICGMLTYEYIQQMFNSIHGEAYKEQPIGNAFDDINTDGYDGNDPIVKVITSQNAVGSVTLLGHVPFVSNTENDIVKSELAKTDYSPEPNWEPKSAPAALKPVVVNGEKVSPFAEGLKKLYKKPTKMPSEQEVKNACSRIHLQYKPKGTDGYIPRVLTLGEAINGTKTEYLTGLKMRTSPGYPFVQGKYQDFGNKSEKGKLRFFKNIQTQQDPLYVPIAENGVNPFMEEYKRLVNLYANGGVFGVRYIDCLKVERRPKEKVAKASTRVFSTANMAYITLCKQLCGMACAVMAEQHNFAESKVGINPHSSEWKIMHDFMTMYEHIIAGDFSAFDGSIIAALLRAIPRVFKNWYKTYAVGTEYEEKYLASLAKMVHQWKVLFNFEIPKEFIITEAQFENTPEGIQQAVDLIKLHKVMIDSTCHDMIVTIRIANGVVYLVIGSMPSGHPFTTFGNNIVNGTATRICYIREGLGTVEDFDREIKSAYTGDDNMHGTDNPKFTMRVLVTRMAELGLTYTDFRKTDEISDFHSWDIVTFLKRGFRKEGSKVFAPLDKNVIYEMPYWIHKQGDPIEATVVNATNALRECIHHGRQFFTDFQNHLRKCLLSSKGAGGLGLSEDQIGMINWSYGRFLAEIESGTFRYSSDF